MSQPHALSLEGTVVAVAANGGHRFSKPLRDRIMLLEGHGVEGDAHAGPFVRHRYLARRRPRAPNLRQIHLMGEKEERRVPGLLVLDRSTFRRCYRLEPNRYDPLR